MDQLNKPAPAVYRGNRRHVISMAGEDVDAAEFVMLTEPVDRFERRLAAIYPDWPQFDAWRWERRAAA